jgi:hypothetical protein
MFRYKNAVELYLDTFVRTQASHFSTNRQITLKTRPAYAFRIHLQARLLTQLDIYVFFKSFWEFGTQHSASVLITETSLTKFQN